MAAMWPASCWWARAAPWRWAWRRSGWGCWWGPAWACWRRHGLAGWMCWCSAWPMCRWRFRRCSRPSCWPPSGARAWAMPWWRLRCSTSRFLPAWHAPRPWASGRAITCWRPVPVAKTAGASPGSMCCPIWPPCSSCRPAASLPWPSWPKRRCPTWGWAPRHRSLRGGVCSARRKPCSTRRPCWPCFPAWPSRCPSWG